MEAKQYKILGEDLGILIDSNLACIASDMITVTGEKVGYMYREHPENDFDSGWRFFSGNENQDYTDVAENFSFYKLNTIANYDPEIIQYLHLPVGAAFERKEKTGEFKAIENS